jgi:hypothetical protein
VSAPHDAGSVPLLAIQDLGTYRGQIDVDSSTGVVSLRNAAPAGAHTITIRATDDCGASSDARFTVTVKAAVDAGVLDTFNRPNGRIGKAWDGLTGTAFYGILADRLEVRLGGPVYWSKTDFGPNQGAFVTLSKVDPRGPSQGLLLKIQKGGCPESGAIAVVHDAKGGVVRVTTLRRGARKWTTYGAAVVDLSDGDKLSASATAAGIVNVYRNDLLIASVTLNQADRAFFSGKGGMIGLWTLGSHKTAFDDFGGGTVQP